jgi:succinoglycan biosynthesis transport protein ExoP
LTQAATGRGFSWAASGKPSGSLAEPMTPGVLARSFLLFVRRNLRLIALVALAVAAFEFGVAAIFLRQYSATAVVMIDPRATRVTEKAGVLANIGSDFNAIESIVQVAKSDGFVGGVVDQLDLAHNPVFAGKGATPALLRQSTIQKLSAHLTVARRGATYVIDVTVKSPSAEESAKVANGVAQRILDDQASLRSGLSASTAREIEKRLTELRVRVNRAERRRRRIQGANQSHRRGPGQYAARTSYRGVEPADGARRVSHRRGARTLRLVAQGRPQRRR